MSNIFLSFTTILLKSSFNKSLSILVVLLSSFIILVGGMAPFKLDWIFFPIYPVEFASLRLLLIKKITGDEDDDEDDKDEDKDEEALGLDNDDDADVFPDKEDADDAGININKSVFFITKYSELLLLLYLKNKMEKLSGLLEL